MTMSTQGETISIEFIGGPLDGDTRVVTPPLPAIFTAHAPLVGGGETGVQCQHDYGYGLEGRTYVFLGVKPR